METYSVVLLILFLNGCYVDGNRDSKVSNDVAPTTTLTTLDPLIQLIVRPLFQKEGNTVCKGDILQCLRPLPDLIKLQEQKLMKIKDEEISRCWKELAIKDEISRKELAIKDEIIMKLTNDTNNLRSYADSCFKLTAYYSCAINYRRNIERSINTVIYHPRKANIEERHIIHRKVQEERGQRRKVLGEICNKLGELAKDYIQLCKYDGKQSNTLLKISAEPTEDESTPQLTSAQLSEDNAIQSNTVLMTSTKPTENKFTPQMASVTKVSQTAMTSVTPKMNAKSTTTKIITIKSIKTTFENQIKKLINMKIAPKENTKDSNFLSQELSWLSKQEQYNDGIWRHWKRYVSLWDENYRVEWKSNALSMPQISQFSNSLQRRLVDENGGLLSKWGVFREDFQNYAIMYENHTRKSSFSELEMKCLWVLYVERGTVLHKAIEMLLEKTPENGRNEWKELQKKSKHNDLLYYEVCMDISVIYDHLSILHSIQSNVKFNSIGCALESPEFNKVLKDISPENLFIVELSQVLNNIFSSNQLLLSTEKINMLTDKPNS